MNTFQVILPSLRVALSGLDFKVEYLASESATNICISLKSIVGLAYTLYIIYAYFICNSNNQLSSYCSYHIFQIKRILRSQFEAALVLNYQILAS